MCTVRSRNTELFRFFYQFLPLKNIKTQLFYVFYVPVVFIFPVFVFYFLKRFNILQKIFCLFIWMENILHRFLHVNKPIIALLCDLFISCIYWFGHSFSWFKSWFREFFVGNMFLENCLHFWSTAYFPSLVS